jgi:hypothetical protein
MGPAPYNDALPRLKCIHYHVTWDARPLRLSRPRVQEQQESRPGCLWPGSGAKRRALARSGRENFET